MLYYQRSVPIIDSAEFSLNPVVCVSVVAAMYAVCMSDFAVFYAQIAPCYNVIK